MSTEPEAYPWEARLHRYLDGDLSSEELKALEEEVQGNEAAVRRFAEILAQEASLKQEAEHWLAEEEAEDADTATPAAGQLLAWRRVAALATAAAVVLGAIAGWLWMEQQGNASLVDGGAVAPAPDASHSGQASQDPAVDPASGDAPSPPAASSPARVEAVATLADARNCKWGGGSLPTEEGALLYPGRLNLLEGLATLRFDSGATVTLEAPAELEVESAMRCRLKSGAIVAWVPDGAEGFQVLTEDALLTDYGTRFGVTANQGGESDVIVLEGEVGVEHRKTGISKRLHTGEMVTYTAEQLRSGDGEIAEPGRTVSEQEKGLPAGWLAITTREGAGKDSYVRLGHRGGGGRGSEPLILAKHSDNHHKNRRKAYLGFDLESLSGRRVAEAALVMEIRPSGLGYASVVPDATFRVYGLTNESGDAWSEETLTWTQAPANPDDHGFALDESQVVLLGEFEVAQGVSSGLRQVDGAALVDFLNADENGIATLIVVRPTDETDGHGLVHAFASREHPTAMPPTLRVRLEE